MECPHNSQKQMCVCLFLSVVGVSVCAAGTYINMLIILKISKKKKKKNIYSAQRKRVHPL